MLALLCLVVVACSLATAARTVFSGSASARDQRSAQVVRSSAWNALLTQARDLGLSRAARADVLVALRGSGRRFYQDERCARARNVVGLNRRACQPRSAVPKGSASLQLTTGGARQSQVLYRRPHGTDWETLDLDTAMDMIADRVLDARRQGWQQEVDGHRTRRSQPGRAVICQARTVSGRRSR